jgi:hypothetical protein
MRFLTLFSILSFSVATVAAQSKPPLDSNVILQVTIVGNQQEFHIGETIPLLLSFKTMVKDTYQVNMAQYDRVGRMNYERFSVSPVEGVVDPLPPSYSGSMGGLTNFKFLAPDPWPLRVNLNEWVRFTQPGEYRLVVYSSRVARRDSATAYGTSPLTTQSNEITVEIIAANLAWQKQVFDEAVKALDARAPEKQQPMEQYGASRRRAAETLRFLGTADAAKELVKRMRGEDPGGLDYVYMLGLISSPERSAVRSALRDALADSDQPISSNFLYTLRMVNSDPGVAQPNWREDQLKAVEELLAALPNKRGKALSTSLTTAANEAWNAERLPNETTDKLINQLVSLFDQLPTNEQNNLLSNRWDKIRGPSLLPILRKYAQTYSDFPEMRESNAYNSLQLSATALRRWYELDPASARPAIITEITRPRPRFDARVLGILPDETLPEVDFALAAHFAVSHDSDGSSHLASLISRYATAAILPQIIERLDAHIGKWGCDIQAPILAYVLRVSPASARERIERALAIRGEGVSACNHELFQGVSEIHYDPLLEEIAIRSLDDPDPQVAMTAATMLGKFASPAAENALWRRYAAWSAKWAGRESQLNVLFPERAGDRIYQVGLGQNLMQALATGKSWLADKSQLQRLSGLTTVPRMQQQLNEFLKLWQTQLSIVIINHQGFSPSFYARVAQYEFHSIDTLKEKLAQFPTGTKFFVSTPPDDSATNNILLADLRTFLTEHGMSLEEKRLN